MSGFDLEQATHMMQSKKYNYIMFMNHNPKTTNVQEQSFVRRLKS